jgi:hypothetical protein
MRSLGCGMATKYDGNKGEGDVRKRIYKYNIMKNKLWQYWIIQMVMEQHFGPSSCPQFFPAFKKALNNAFLAFLLLD